MLRYPANWEPMKHYLDKNTQTFSTHSFFNPDVVALISSACWCWTKPTRERCTQTSPSVCSRRFFRYETLPFHSNLCFAKNPAKLCLFQVSSLTPPPPHLPSYSSYRFRKSGETWGWSWRLPLWMPRWLRHSDEPTRLIGQSGNVHNALSVKAAELHVWPTSCSTTYTHFILQSSLHFLFFFFAQDVRLIDSSSLLFKLTAFITCAWRNFTTSSTWTSPGTPTRTRAGFWRWRDAPSRWTSSTPSGSGRARPPRRVTSCGVLSCDGVVSLRPQPRAGLREGHSGDGAEDPRDGGRRGRVGFSHRAGRCCCYSFFKEWLNHGKLTCVCV